MPARTQESLRRKQTNRQSQRDILREIRIKQKGGESVDVLYGKPLSDEERQSRIKLEKELNNSLLNNKLQALPYEKLTKKSYAKRGDDRTQRSFLLSTLRSAKIRAKALSLPFNLTIDDLVLPKHCPVFGTEMFWSNKITDDTPSLDRLIPSKGYIKGNVAFISYKANRMKSNGSLQDLELLVSWMKAQMSADDIFVKEDDPTGV